MTVPYLRPKIETWGLDPTHSRTRAMLGAWRFSDGGGTGVTDYGPNRRHATFNSKSAGGINTGTLPTWLQTNPIVGRAMRTGAPNDPTMTNGAGASSVNDAIFKAPVFTIAATVYNENGYSGNRTIASVFAVTAGDGWILRRETGGAVNFYIYSGGAWRFGTAVASVTPIGEWTRIAATYDAKTMRLYKDGRKIQENVYAGAPAYSTNVGLSIGENWDRATLMNDFWDGSISEVIYAGEPWSDREVMEDAVDPDAIWLRAGPDDGKIGHYMPNYGSMVTGGW